MTAKVKILFDECLSKAMMHELADLLQGDHQFAHVCDHFQSGTPDDVWIPKMAKDGGWIVISTDGGKNRALRGKLPALCAHYGITHIIFGPALHMRKATEKVGALLLVWPQIELLCDEPPGTRFNLRLKTSRHHAGLQIVLEKVPAKKGNGGKRGHAE